MTMSQPGMAGSPDAPSVAPTPTLVCEDVVQEFRIRSRGRRQVVSAVAGVTFQISRGETFAIVGETGSGKSTLARSIIRAPAPRSGRIVVSGRELTGKSPEQKIGSLVQMIFQDPFTALDPKWTVERIVTEPLASRGESASATRRRKVAAILTRVGLAPSLFAQRQPHELSGGQAQRVAIARALIGAPGLLICDEPVTALDVSIQAQILQLLFDLKRELNLTYLLIAHDLAVVRVLADRTATMYLGKLFEIGPTSSMFDAPAHPYTEALLSAIPRRPGAAIVGERIRLGGEPPSPMRPPPGCRFHTRCKYAQDICIEQVPQLREIGPGRSVACHFPLIDAGSRFA
jgi:oligopeptide/dipeptide ABC transporter ATP-binding protein